MTYADAPVPGGPHLRPMIYIPVTIRPHKAIGSAAMRPVPARLLLAALTAGWLFASTGAGIASAQPAEFLPSTSALYEDLEALTARGLLAS